MVERKEERVLQDLVAARTWLCLLSVCLLEKGKTQWEMASYSGEGDMCTRACWVLSSLHIINSY